MRSVVLSVLLVLGCRQAPQVASPPAQTVPTPPPDAATALEDAALPTLPSPDDRCPLPVETPTIELGPRQSLRIESGLTVRYLGSVHDHYDDGRFEVLAHLQFSRGGEPQDRRPNALAPPVASEVLGHCFRLLGIRNQAAVLQLAPLPSPSRPPSIQRVEHGRCEPMPRAHTPCQSGDGPCVLSWGQPQGWSSALWCRDGRWVIENERNL